MRKPVKKKCKKCKSMFLCFRKNGIFCSRHCAGSFNMNIFHASKNYMEKFCLILNKAEIVNDCWIWPQSKDRKGYGQYHTGRHRTHKAHRYSYEIFNEKIPDQLLVCHSCDVPPCVNPRHLWVGTNYDNMQDKMKKGRHKTRRIRSK